MGAIAYLDFDLQILHVGKSYRAQVLDSPGGQASVEFTQPVSDLELENFFLRIGQGRLVMRGGDQPDIEAVKKLGGKLFTAVFRDDVLACWRSSLDEATRRQAGLRIRLRLTDAPELADLPWEFLFNPARNQFLSLSSTTPLVRYLDIAERIRPLEVQPPLRVLVVISSPSDYPRLDVDREWTHLRGALEKPVAQGRLELERVEGASLSALQHILRKRDFHIFHFIGHGCFDPKAQEGYLVFEDQDHRGRLVGGQDLGVLLHNHPPMRLAFLNACEGARAARNDPFAGAAQSLAQQGLPAVIAMQFKITDEAAILFSQEFYSAVADGYPVDAALADSRVAIFAQGWSPEWGTPVLYLRSHDGRIYDVQRKSEVSRPVPVEHRSPEKAANNLARAVAAGSPSPPRQPEAVQTAPPTPQASSSPPAVDVNRQAAQPPPAPPPQGTSGPVKVVAAAPIPAAPAPTTPTPIAPDAAQKVAPEQAKRPAIEEYRERVSVIRVAALCILVAVAVLLALKLWWPPRKSGSPSAQPPVSSAPAPSTQPITKNGPAPIEPNPAPNVLPSPPANPPKPAAKNPPPAKPPVAHPANGGAKPPAAPPVEPKPLRVGGNVPMPNRVNLVEPEYPQDARAANVQGVVSLEAVIARDGTVKQVKVLSGSPLLTESSVRAVKQWRYDPTVINGKAVEVIVPIDVAYKLKPAEPAPAPAQPAPVASSHLPGEVLAPMSGPCTLGKADFKNQGSKLVVTVPYTYQGTEKLGTIALLGFPLDASQHQISSLKYGEWTLNAPSGTASVSVESRPTLGHQGAHSEYLDMVVIIKGTTKVVCSQVLYYPRQW